MKHLKLFETFDEILEIIDDSYNDYISIVDTKSKEVMARHIKRTAVGFIKNRISSLSDWLDKFKDEEIVMKEFAPLIFDNDIKKYNL